MTQCIALLRGINVGGNKKIRMADLKTLAEALGFTGVQTLLQSGNLVFDAAETDAEAITRALEAAIQKTFGFESKIILRTGDQLRAVVEKHPYSAEQLSEPAKILVMFMVKPPDAGAFDAMQYAGPEEFSLRGQELYLYYPEGMGRSKLAGAWIERRLKTLGTGRNWNTVTKLLDMVG